MDKFFLQVLLPIFLLFVISIICLFLNVNHNIVWLINNIGTLLILVSNVIWAAMYDSKKYWPNTNFFQRLSYILTFKSK